MRLQSKQNWLVYLQTPDEGREASKRSTALDCQHNSYRSKRDSWFCLPKHRRSKSRFSQIARQRPEDFVESFARLGSENALELPSRRLSPKFSRNFPLPHIRIWSFLIFSVKRRYERRLTGQFHRFFLRESCLLISGLVLNWGRIFSSIVSNLFSLT